MFGICSLSIVACRKLADSKSEMVSQLLFGEHFEIIEEDGEWYLIRNAYDSYTSWVSKKQVTSISEALFKKINHSPTVYSNDVVHSITTLSNPSTFPIVIGSHLPFYQKTEWQIGENKYAYTGQVIQQPKYNKQVLVETAQLFLNSPYLWGGCSPFGIDCSGFTQLVFKLNGIPLLRDAYQQAKQGTALSLDEKAEPGDLAFFDDEAGAITHVGIVLKNQQVIHASGRVRINQLDHKGILNAELNAYTHHLNTIRRMK